MTEHKITIAEEMYLITISVMHFENPTKPVPISSLAAQLDVQPVSANQMVRKMAEEGWVDYLPYQGVLLTKRGSEHANRVLRLRRLWEVFLVRDLSIPLDEAEIIACDLEHHISEEVGARLEDFLGYPEHCYHGKPIPRQMGQGEKSIESIPLKELKIGIDAPILRIQTDETTQKFLANEGVRPGVRVKISAIGSLGDFLIECVGKRIHLSKEIASAIILAKEKLK